MRHLDLWAYNAYPGKNFTAFNWDAYAAYVKKPLLISEYGIDAYDSDADPKLNLGFERDDIDVGGGDGSGVFVMGSPRDEIQAEWLLSLIEDLERHSTTCEGTTCCLYCYHQRASLHRASHHPFPTLSQASRARRRWRLAAL